MRNFLYYFGCVIVAAIILHYVACQKYHPLNEQQYEECKKAIELYSKQGKEKAQTVYPNIIIDGNEKSCYAYYKGYYECGLTQKTKNGKTTYIKHSPLRDDPFWVSGFFFAIFFIIFTITYKIRNKIDSLIVHHEYILERDNPKKYETKNAKMEMKKANKSTERCLLEFLIKLIIVIVLLKVCLDLFEFNGIVAAAVLQLILGGAIAAYPTAWVGDENLLDRTGNMVENRISDTISIILSYVYAISMCIGFGGIAYLALSIIWMIFSNIGAVVRFIATAFVAAGLCFSFLNTESAAGFYVGSQLQKFLNKEEEE